MACYHMYMQNKTKYIKKEKKKLNMTVGKIPVALRCTLYLKVCHMHLGGTKKPKKQLKPISLCFLHQLQTLITQPY